MGRVGSYVPREPLLHQGAAVDDVIVIESGLVKVSTVADGGEEIILDLRGPGDVIGEMSAIDGEPRSATVAALIDTRARRIPAEVFRSAVTADAELSMGLLRYLVRHLRDSDRSRLWYVAADSFERIVALFVELATRHGEPCGRGRIVVAVGLTHAELAQAAAVSLEAFNRGLSKLRRAGIVSTTRRRELTINDLPMLRTITTANPPNMS